MEVPATLATGLVSIYGVGSNLGIRGITLPTSGFKYGTIYQVADEGIYGFQVNQSVLFAISDVKCKLAYQGNTFSVIEAEKLILTENPPD